MAKESQNAPGTDMDLSKVADLSEDSLKSLREIVEQQIAAREKQRIKDVQQEYKRLADSIGMTPMQVVQDMMTQDKSSRSGKAVAGAKYCHPSDLTLTWSGRGKRPNWLREELSAGKELEDFLIK